MWRKQTRDCGARSPAAMLSRTTPPLRLPTTTPSSPSFLSFSLHLPASRGTLQKVLLVAAESSGANYAKRKRISVLFVGADISCRVQFHSCTNSHWLGFCMTVVLFTSTSLLHVFLCPPPGWQTDPRSFHNVLLFDVLNFHFTWSQSM